MTNWITPISLWLLSWPVLRDSVDRSIFVSQSHSALSVVDQRYADHPIAVFLHLLPGILFFIVGPLQFCNPVQAWRNLHRIFGYIYSACALCSAISVMYMVLVFPALGGWITIIVTWAICTLMCTAIVGAIQAARARQILIYQRLMRLSLALGLTVATARIYIALAERILRLDFIDSFTIASALGVTTNLTFLMWIERKWLRRLIANLSNKVTFCSKSRI